MLNAVSVDDTVDVFVNDSVVLMGGKLNALSVATGEVMMQ